MDNPIRTPVSPPTTRQAKRPRKEQGLPFGSSSIQTKIVLWGAFLLLLATGVLIAYSATTLRARSLETAVNQIEAEADVQALEVASTLEVALDTARTLAESLSAVKGETPVRLTRAQVNAMLRSTLEANPQFLGIYTLWEPNAFDGQDAQFANTEAHDATGRFIPYWTRDEQDNLSVSALLDYETPGIGDYYLLPRSTKKEQAISPFLYPIGGEDVLLTSWVVPIVVDGQFYGIAGVDLRTDYLQELANDFDFFNGLGTIALVGGDGTLAGVTDQPKAVGQAVKTIFPDFAELTPALLERRTVTQTLSAENTLRVFQPVSLGRAETPWSLAISVPLDEVTAGVRRSVQQLIGITVVSLALALLALFYLARGITKPIQSLTKVAARVGEGDLTQLATVKTKDEIGTLGTTLNNTIVQLREAADRDQLELERSRELQGNISNFLDVAMTIADGDFTKRGQVSEDVLGNVVDAINLMVEELSYLLKNVQDTVYSVRDGADEMIQTSGSISERSRLQVSQAQSAREEVRRVTGAMLEMAQNADASADAARRALKASQEGEEAVQNTLAGMQGIRREVQGISKRIKGLGDRSLEISEIVETISRISRQTNLLALNAAIEAAGAGEAGGRFAIVANEVRKLADDSAQATQRVAALIKTVQSEVQEVVGSVEGGTREVEEGYRVAGEAGERLREIAQIVTQAAEYAVNISQATQQQVRGVEQVGSAVNSIAGATEASQVQINQGRKTAQRLEELSSELSANLARFRLA